jgi:hypothetical protein
MVALVVALVLRAAAVHASATFPDEMLPSVVDGRVDWRPAPRPVGLHRIGCLVGQWEITCFEETPI